MYLASEHAAIHAVAPSEDELDQHRPSGSSANSEDASLEQLQQQKGLHSDQEEPDLISPLDRPSDPSQPSSCSQNALPPKEASVAVISLRRSTSISRSSLQSPNLDNPIEELDGVVRYFASNHGLMKELPIIEQAAHAERDEMEAFQDLLPDDKAAMEDESEAPFLAQSRSLKGAVLVVGTLSGVCQGWAQSVLNGTGRY
jgi:hypothetical protein